MGITSSQALIKSALNGIDLIEIDQAELSESGVFILYDGGIRTAMGIVDREFAIFCAGFSISGESGLKQVVEDIEHSLYEISRIRTDIEHTQTLPIAVADNGLLIYRINVKIIDMES
ncbi:MAG: hypothetical protein CJD30_03555 [Sulfuricurvum sp. PD_MW2]|uniref:hypothetical protein n=1 Tax=Sulfuricurvum sp. PD_MW2 TaxID=2027917 RepID=UPI000C066BD6|nr:hypothetical protein [Sulfuricurvum sp. PD_MW2]PHM18049.1 MAG: hypothetical protein CJD30_03555 [Sulfuricurvum sp. PD_MW2]